MVPVAFCVAHVVLIHPVGLEAGFLVFCEPKQGVVTDLQFLDGGKLLLQTLSLAVGSSREMSCMTLAARMLVVGVNPCPI